LASYAESKLAGAGDDKRAEGLTIAEQGLLIVEVAKAF
jgi:hypothetical protein